MASRFWNRTPATDDDYQLYKMWWYATFYNASPEMRMKLMDEKRKSK
jgi:hypothetical protein